MKLYYIHYLKNILFREPSFILKFYLHKRIIKTPDAYVFMADGKMVHGGLFDRLKGAISIYALSKAQGKEFNIYFKKPFDLSKYLQPNLYDWNINEDDINYCYPESRPVIAYSENRNPRRLLKNRIGQTHFYFGGDILDVINLRYGTNYQWATLFHELFSPSDNLMGYVSARKKEIGSDYDAVHLRFVNLLGDNIEAVEYQELNTKAKKSLMEQCVEKIVSLNADCKKTGRKLVVASDSMAFLNELNDCLPEVYIISGNVRHVDKADGATEDDLLKLFADIYMLAGAERVYSIVGGGLYPSAFPEYSAKIGRKQFERIRL